MAGVVYLAVISYLLIGIPFGSQQNVDNTARNIFDALSTTVDCGQFKSLIIGAGLRVQDFYTHSSQLTVFVPNNTAFEQMRAEKRKQLFDMTPQEKENYVKSYTLVKILETSSMTEDLIEESLGGPGSTNIFFNKRNRRLNDIVSGTAGRTEYYANGAYIFKGDIRAQNGIIHMIDRVLDPIIASKIYGYLQLKQMKFYTEVTNYVSGEYYDKAIAPLQTSRRFTLFVPTDAAIDKIPKEKLEELRANQFQLVKVIQQHAIPSKAIYTSFVYHNEGEQCINGRVIFKKNVREIVYVSGGGVNTLISQGNLTLSNGVIHFVDNLLGFVYNTAREQIQLDTQLSSFNDVLNRGRKELQDALVMQSGVTVFTPMNDAFTKLNNLPNINFFNNQTLINQVLELQLLEPGTEFEITNINGDYMARQEERSRYRGWSIKVYSQGNDTWAEGGYVKARVIRPDVGVTNGLVHYTDSVFGVPSRDVPGIIYCEDWLIKSSYVLSIVGLNDFLKDSRITVPLPACSYDARRRDYNYAIPGIGVQSSNPLKSSWNQASDGGDWITPRCGAANRYCEFTIFVPNGTTVDDFQQSYYGRELFTKPKQLHMVLSRHIILGRKVYIDQLGRGQHSYNMDNGDMIFLTKISDFYSELAFRRVRARVLHSDLGATNGVVHIIDSFLFVPDDLTGSSTIPRAGWLIHLIVILSCLHRMSVR